MIPNAEAATTPTADYIAMLIRSTGKSASWCARRIGVTDRYLRKLTAGDANASYAVQFALESLAEEMAKVQAARQLK